jgi:hypothetical protein
LPEPGHVAFNPARRGFVLRDIASAGRDLIARKVEDDRLGDSQTVVECKNSIHAQPWIKPVA